METGSLIRLQYERTEQRRYVPSTVFGKAVAESGFNRVCPRCFRRWSSRIQWLHDTAASESVRTEIGMCGVRECSCGGHMLVEGYSYRGAE